ncbi:MAG TPA: alpha/beta fold hydrolase [Longimicrobium sp.]|nr:alpha/beta fold hydrolase [Longimicrobium sp.]
MPTRSLPRLALAAAALALASAAPARAQAPAFVPGTCPPDTIEGARCGTVAVPENRDDPGRMLALSVVVVPARSAAPARRALAFFEGGPGAAVTPGASWIAGEFAPLRDDRDLLFVDQRGSGGSAPLQCRFRDPADPQSYIDGYMPPPAVARCLEELRRGADLTRYGFVQHAHDMEAVRAALGYERLDLYGSSYGTRGALVYLRTYPRSVGSAVLLGLVPPGFRQPADYARDTEAAFAGIAAGCRADAACGAAFPGLEREAREVVRRLDAGRGAAEIVDSETGRRVRLTISRGDFVETIRRMMYDPGPARTVPYVIHRAHQGDFRPVMRTALADRRGLAEGIFWGLQLSITCSEDVPFIDQAAAAAENATTLLGDYRVREQTNACRGWPTFSVPADYHQPFPTDVPTLLISGEHDPVTPVRWGTMAAAAHSNSLHVIVPHAGHGYGGLQGTACLDSMVIRFYQQASVRGLDPSACLAGIRPPPFVTDVPETITLDRAAVERFAGTYASTEPPLEVRFEALDGVLRARVDAFDLTVVASPLSATEFRWEGFPPSYVFRFSEDGRTLTMPGRNQPTMTLTRR